MNRRQVLVIQPLRQEALALLDERDDIAYHVVTDISEANLLSRVADIDAITIRDALLSSSVIAAARRLKIVSRHGVGYDNIPVDACTARGIPVTVVGPVNSVAVAEQTMLLMLMAARAAIELDAATRAGDFAARGRIQGVELKGRRLLVVGFGRIGREVAARGEAFGMRVSVFDPYFAPNANSAVTVIGDLSEALRSADVVSLHVPLTEATRHMLGAAELALLPRGAIVVNASRGGLIDEAALLEAVRTRHLHGAGLDTFETEPLPVDSALLGERRIALSPHSAALTDASLLAMGLTTVRNALAGLDGTLDPNLVVNRSVLSGADGAFVLRDVDAMA